MIVWTKALAESIEIDLTEPYAVPCSNPPECEAVDIQIAKDNNWDKWDYVAKSRDPAKLGAPIRVKGYTNAMKRAWETRLPKSHPTPRSEDDAGMMLFVIARP